MFDLIVIAGVSLLIISGILIFILNQKRIKERSLRINSQNYISLFRDNQSIILIFIPGTGQIIEANTAACHFYGYRSHEFRQLTFHDIESLPRLDVSKILKKMSHRPHYMESRHRLKNGKVRNVELYTGQIRIKDLTYNYAIIHDISARVKSNKILLEAKEKAEESDRLKSSFLANMSHEIRTPMNSIIGFSSLLRDEVPTNATLASYIDSIQKNGEHLLQLINDIIDLSKIEANQLSIHLDDYSLNAILKEVYVDSINNLKNTEKKQLTLNLKTPEHRDLKIKTDAIRLRQVLLNLINNAIKFTDHGSIEFGYKIREDGLLQFCVKDTGIGIPDEKYQLIFNPFRQIEEDNTRNYQGAGLGLPICRSLVEKMGGHIWLMSEEGKGSRFYFTHPLH